MIFTFFASHDDIIDAGGNVLVKLGVKYRCDGSIECATCVAKPLGHSYIVEVPKGVVKLVFSSSNFFMKI